MWLRPVYFVAGASAIITIHICFAHYLPALKFYIERDMTEAVC